MNPSRNSTFSIEFKPAAFDPSRSKTDVTVYRYGNGSTLIMSLEEMRVLRDRLTAEIDRQAEDAISFMSQYPEEK
jgi:hypothetical protein